MEKEFKEIGKIIDSNIFPVKLENRSIKTSTIFSFWGDVVGRKFIKFSKPYSIKGSILFVSCKSPVVMQELEMFKNEVIKKFNLFAEALNFKIKDITFSYKNWSEVNAVAAESEPTSDMPAEIDKDKIKNTELDEATIEETKQAIENISFLTQSQKEDFLKKILNSYKAKKLQK